MLNRIPPRGWVLAILVIWGGAILALHLLRLEPYGIDEAGARALLLNWTVTDRVVNPIVAFGAPDLRALLFTPLGLYWPGSIIAVKVFTMLVTFGAALFLYQWSKRMDGDESALLATGLLLIAPLTIAQIDALGAGPYLLILFGLGWWLDQRYRRLGRPLGGWYFLQLLIVIVTVSIHPAGLAYPLALAWEWYRRPIDTRQQRHFYIGLSLAVIFILLFRLGWGAVPWGENPLASLGQVFIGYLPGQERAAWAWGTIPAALLLAVLLRDTTRLWDDLLGRMLLIATVVGLSAAGSGWALIAFALTLYRLFPWLIQVNESLALGGLMGQRGVVLVVLFITATAFMLGDKALRHAVLAGSLSSTDQLIKNLVVELQERDQNPEVQIISQWPARTMLATKQPVFPLPPPVEDTKELIELTQGSDYLVFDPYDKANAELRRHVSRATDVMKTVMALDGGTIVSITKPGSPLEDNDPTPAEDQPETSTQSE